MPGSKRRWPLEPIEQYVERLNTTVFTLATGNGLGEDRAKRIERVIREAKANGGLLTTTGMDSVCIDGLGKHPSEIYGELYFSSEMDPPRLGRKPCERCGGEKSSGNKHLCTACQLKDESRTCACGCGEPVATSRSLYADRSHQFRVRAA